AERSGSAKTTIYRWWPSKAAILLDAYINTRARHIPSPETGKLKTDLEWFVRQTCRALRETSAGPAMAALMAEAQRDDAVRSVFREQWIASRRKVLKSLFSQAIARGELSEDVDLELAADFVYGPIWYRLLNGHAALSDRFARALVAQLLTGLK